MRTYIAFLSLYKSRDYVRNNCIKLLYLFCSILLRILWFLSYFLAEHEFTAYRAKVYLSTISIYQCDMFFKRRRKFGKKVYKFISFCNSGCEDNVNIKNFIKEVFAIFLRFLFYFEMF